MRYHADIFLEEGKTQISVRTAGVMDEIQTKYLLNKD
jgi:hypothetical protein